MSVVDNKIKLNITLELDQKWASRLTKEELTEYLKARLNYCLGFRGEVKKMTPIRIK